MANQPNRDSMDTNPQKWWAEIIGKLDPTSRALGLIGFLAEALFVAALARLPDNEILYALVVCAVILVLTIAGIVVIQTFNSRSSGRIAAGVTPSAKTPDTELLNQLVNGAIETVCRAVSIPETPDSAKLRVFIFRKEGDELVCSHFWAANPVEEAVGITRFKISSETAEHIAVVRAALNGRITRAPVKPLSREMKEATGEVSDDVQCVLAAPIRKADRSIWGVVDFDAGNEKGKNLLFTEVSDYAMYQLAQHIQLIVSSYPERTSN